MAECEICGGYTEINYGGEYDMEMCCSECAIEREEEVPKEHLDE